jgi:ABC-2 type transport system permease protein
MIGTLRRRVGIYSAFGTMMPKLFLAYSAWVWMQLFVNLLALVIFVSFWRAVYANSTTVGGLSYAQTINYILLAQIFAPLAFNTNLIFEFGMLLREGRLAIELLRPVDFQAQYYVRTLAESMISLFTQIPLALVAWLVFDLRIPTDGRVWIAFLISLLLGNAVLFLADWMLSCVAFYITEIWGLSVVRAGVADFFSGALVPLAIMPGWLQAIALALPFAQAIGIPIQILSGITPLSAAPRIWLFQLATIAILLPLSRLVFNRALRVVTVQGG